MATSLKLNAETRERVRPEYLGPGPDGVYGLADRYWLVPGCRDGDIAAAMATVAPPAQCMD